MGLVYPVRFGGFCHIKNKSKGGNLHETKIRKEAAGTFVYAGNYWSCAGDEREGVGG